MTRATSLLEFGGGGGGGGRLHPAPTSPFLCDTYAHDVGQTADRLRVGISVPAQPRGF